MTKHLIRPTRISPTVRPGEAVETKTGYGVVVAPNRSGDLGQSLVGLYERKVIGPDHCPTDERKDLATLSVYTQQSRRAVIANRGQVPKERVDSGSPAARRSANSVSDPHDFFVCVASDEPLFVHSASLAGWADRSRNPRPAQRSAHGAQPDHPLRVTRSPRGRS